jgi:hypothetical protein
MAENGVSPMFSQDTEMFDGSKRSSKLFMLLVGALVIALAIAGYLLYRRYFIPEAAAPQTETVPAPTESAATRAEMTVTDPVVPTTNANYQSESFRIGEVAIGGEADLMLSGDTPDPLAVNGIRGEAFTEKNRPEVKLVLSWKTNKLAKSEVTYSKGVGQPEKTATEDDFSFNHSLVIPGLDQASTYVYAITAHDRFGGKMTSESHAVYTGSKTVSLFDLIAGAVGDVFGWAVSK